MKSTQETVMTNTVQLVSWLAKNVVGSDQTARAGLAADNKGSVGVLGSNFGELACGNIHAAAGLNVVHDGDEASDSARHWQRIACRTAEQETERETVFSCFAPVYLF